MSKYYEEIKTIKDKQIYLAVSVLLSNADFLYPKINIFIFYMKIMYPEKYLNPICMILKRFNNIKTQVTEPFISYSVKV